MSKRVLLLVLVILVSTMELPAASAKRPVVIISAAQAKNFGLPNESPFWTPTQKQISLLESLLPLFLKSNPPKYDKPVSNPLDYGCQYVGVTKNGEKLIFLNAFCPSFIAETSNKYWFKQRVMVLDGGSCFFHVYFNPRTNKFSGLQYNGVA